MEVEIQPSFSAFDTNIELSAQTVAGSIESTIVIGASLANAIDSFMYSATALMFAVIVTDQESQPIVSAIVDILATDGTSEGQYMTNEDGYVNGLCPPDGFIVLSKDGFQSQRHRFTVLDSYVLIQLSMMRSVSVIHTPKGHFINASPGDPVNSNFL